MRRSQRRLSHLQAKPPADGPPASRGQRREQTMADEQLHLLLEAGDLGIWDWDLRTGTIVWAGRHAQVMGLAEGAFDGRYETFARTVHPDDLPGVEAAVAHARDTRASYVSEYRVIWPDGSIHWAAGRGRFFYDEAGRPLRMLGVIQDITERRLAEERACAADAERDRLLTHLQLVMGRMPIGCIVSDAEYRIAAWNPAAEQIFGFSAAEMLGRLPDDAIMTPEVRARAPAIRDEIRRGMLTGGTIRESRTRDGRVIVCEWAHTPLHDEAGTFLGFVSMVQDVTERRLAEQRLRAVNAERDQLLGRLQLVLERMPIGCVMNDPDFTITYWNPAAERIFGYSAAEMLGRSPYGLIVPHEARPYVEALRERLQAGDTTAHGRNQNLTKDGRVIFCEWANTPLFDETGAFIGYLAMVQDVTERHRQEEQIAALNADLERRVAERTAELGAKNRELEIFTSSVSHDLKAPLRGIDGYSRLLQEDHAAQLDEEGRSFIRQIRAATAQMGSLIDDLLAYSRLEQRALRPRLIDLPALVAEVCAEFEAELRASGARLTVELEPGRIMAEPEGLSQAVRNLVDNAVKFSRGQPEPLIAVNGTREADHYLIRVRDNGPGFAMEYHDRIFEIFQRLHRPEEYPGTGIGLAIVRKAMERLGGRAWAESAPGQGASFYLSLPASPREQP